MAKVYEFLADGFEEVEGLGPVDVLRRGGVEVKTVSVTGSEMVSTSHGVTVKADLLFEDADFSDADLLMMPGGLPGSATLDMHEGLHRVLAAHNEAGKLIGAICAAPMVLGRMGLLKGRRATCYPGFDKYLEGAEYTSELVTVDGNFVTGKGPAATLPYAYKLLEFMAGEEKAREVAEGMGFFWR
ncbi:DJ-1 family glyoxalase III [Prevotella sp. HCN-7019]|uniref:DJ-1 family glyoxalase III n=1 Tax=Prevotella sp. HCN-7019 TaxID=3134668 RepID=UPI00261AC22D